MEERNGVVVVGEILRPGSVPAAQPSEAGPSKIYVEPTSRCNLSCRFCFRQTWNEPLRDMEEETFAAILEGVRELRPCPTVFFGGIGEPLAHPRLPKMVAEAKEAGARVELVTNGTLLGEEVGHELIAAGLDLLWVSLDGATPQRYGDLRLGAALPDVLENVRRFRSACSTGHHTSEVGIAFVAMRRNVADLPALLDLAGRLGATRFRVSHLLAHTEEMLEETLYPQVPFSHPPQFLGSCPFVEAGAIAIGWDGSLSPCLPLLHSSVSFLHGAERVAQRFAVGKVGECSLGKLWGDPVLQAFRRRVKDFQFAPCASCGSCSWGYSNEKDCLGSPFPTCGGCLWAYGLLSCP